jgi:hypothetical protein
LKVGKIDVQTFKIQCIDIYQNKYFRDGSLSNNFLGKLVFH